MANTTVNHQLFRNVCCRVYRDEFLVDVQCLVRTVAADILLLDLLMIVDQYRVLYPRRPSGLVGNHEHLCEEVMSSIFCENQNLCLFFLNGKRENESQI